MSTALRKPVGELLARNSARASRRCSSDISPRGRPFLGTEVGTVQCQRVRSAPENGNDARSRPSGDNDARNARAAASTDAASDGAARAGRTPSARPATPVAASRSATDRVSLGSRLSSFTSDLLRNERSPSSACPTGDPRARIPASSFRAHSPGPPDQGRSARSRGQSLDHGSVVVAQVQIGAPCSSLSSPTPLSSRAESTQPRKSPRSVSGRW